MNVTKVAESDWKKDDGTVTHVTKVTFDDGREVPGYDLPSVPEVGKPLPDGWEIATSKNNKPYIKVPKSGKGFSGGGTAYRNTKEGQAFEQQQMNRRTAIMCAKDLLASVPWDDRQKMADMADALGADVLLLQAQDIYDWLQSSPASGHTESTTTTAPLPRGNTAAGSSPGTSPSGEVADTTSVGERVTPASSDAPRGREGSGQVEVAPDPSHIHDLHPLRAGSKIMRCSVAGCPHTERRDVA